MAKKKLSERIREDIEKNKEESENLKKQANEDFVKRFGNGDTNPSHTTTYKNIINAMDNNNAKQDLKKRNNLTLWDQIKALASGGGYIARKTGAGAVGGVVGIGQAGLTDTANQLRKGEQSKNSVVKNITNALIGLTNSSHGISNVIDSNKNIISTLLDKNKNNVEKITDIFTKSASNSLDMLPFKQTSNNILQAVGKINNQMDDEVLKLNEGISRPVENINTKLQEEGNQYGEATKWLGDVGQTVGNMIPSIAGSVVTKNPSVGLGAMGLSAKGQSTTEALKKGVDIEKAVDIGNAKALIEIATEKLAGGVKFFGKGNLDDLAEEFIKKGSKSTFGKFLMKQGYNVSGEITEELISNIADNMIDKGTTDPDKKIIDLKEGIDTIGKTALSTLILNGLGGYQQDYNDAKQQTLEQQKQFKDYNTGKAVDENTQKTMEQAQEIIKQNQDNKAINQETKTSQNRFSQEQNIMKAQTSINLDKVKKFYDEDTFNQMKQFVETAPNENALKQINEDIKTETRHKLEETYKSEKFTESQERKKTFAKYQRENNTNGIQYNSDVVNNALDTVSANRNGRRTVEQWKKVANQIGIEASNLSKAEIEKIAYGSWFDVEPTKNITRYDNQTKTNKSFEKFTSDDWVNTIYESAKAQKIQQLETALATEQYSLSSPEIQNNYEYKQSDNTKVDTFRQDASKFWDNSEKTTKLVNTIEKVINDKGYNIRLDDTLGENVNGKIVTNSNGEIEITLNPNSSRAGEFILGHELTHAIQTQEMVDLVNQRMQKDGDLKNAVEDLKKLYNTDDINAEVLADISGQLFGNQEFINNLSIEKPSVFKRIYDKIISLANKITGNSSEALFIKDLKSKWEKAYRENTNAINEAQYSKTSDLEVKQQQNKIIQENNPLDKTLGEHTWINSADDIKTYQEAIAEYGEIEDLTPDFTAEDVKKALDTGKVTVYSSHPIEQGTFVTPSKMEAQSYAGKSEVYSKEVNLSDIAWIDELQGQYAKVEAQNNNTNITTDNQGRQLSKQQQEYFKDSKVRDENGNLLTVYHGSNSEFNIFDLSKGGQSNSGASIGFWFTESKEGAENFANEVWYGDKKPNAKEVYLDMKNPKIYENIENDEQKQMYKEKSEKLEKEAKNLRKEYSWDKTDYKTTMTFDTLLRDYQTEKYTKQPVNIELFKGLAKERGFNDEQISKMEKDAKEYVRLMEESKKAENEYYKFLYSDAYEQYKIDLYEVAGQTAEDANVGGLGMALNNPKETVEKFRNKLISEGYDGIIIKNTQYDKSSFNGTNNQYVIFNSNQAKNVNNQNPTSNPDIRYSKQNQSWQDYLEKNYKSEGTTTDLRDIRLPMKEKQEVKLPMKQENTQQTQERNNNTKGKNINWNEIERPEENRKFRKHYKSIIESDNTTAEAKSIAKELMGTDTYVPETNKGQLAQADQRITTSSPEAELQALRSRVLNGERITSVDIAVGERLIQYFSKTGSAEQLQDAIQTTALAGTSTGQTLQALTILNHQTPQGQVTWLQRSIDKMNKELAKKKGGTITTDADGNIQIVNKQGKDITNKVDLFNLTPEMMNKIMQSENQEQMLQNIDEVYEELGQQVPKSMLEKVDSWRYFSMLANIRTHGRNMIGNFAMGKMQRVKDKLAGGIEDVVSKFNPEMERTKTLRRADKKTKEFAKNDFKNVEVQSRLELNESKFNPQSRLQNARRTFKHDALENTLGRLFDLNDKLLEAEDGIGLKAGYQKALADYITANKIDVDNITDAQLGKARNYAIQQAKEATFHQANAIASAVTQFQNKNNVTKFFVDALLPFKKTPMNVAKAGMEYSPLQIAKSATVDLVNLRKGNISINQYIDNLSKGMTGTGITLAGYALAKAGILKASGGDDKDKEKYDEEQGKQSYSIEIAGKTYSLDWLAPTGIPLFIGAETFKLFNQEETEKNTEKSSEEDRLKQAVKGASNLLNAGATAINPMSEMSMISGLTSALSSYNTSDNLGSLGNMMTNMGKSYVNQFFPTLMGQVAKTGDEYERTTKSTATGTIGKALDQTINQIKNKVPGLRQTLPIKTDIWGKEVKQEVNLPLRAVNNFINPATVKEVSTDKVDMELNKLYEENRNSALLPDILTKTVQLNKQTYRLSNKEYAEFTKNYGQTSHKLIENFIKTSDYNKLTQEQKETAIANIYSYAKETNKLDYAKKVNETIKPSTLYTTMKEIEENGGKQSEYLSYLAKTKGMSKESEKNGVLANSDYSNKTKEIIYVNGTGKDDNLYNELLINSNIDMTEYLDYKNKTAEKEFSADKDSNGKTISGSAKKKVINYLNENITGVGNRLLIAGNSYVLTNSEKQSLVEYINKIATTKDEKLQMYKQLNKNFTVKDGKVYMKISK